MSFELVKVAGRRSPVRLRVKGETDRALSGWLVDKYGREVRRFGKPFAIHLEKEFEGGTWEVLTVIPHELIESRSELVESLKYGDLVPPERWREGLEEE